MNRTDLLSKREKEIDNRITVVLTYHPALNKVYQILQKAHRHTLKSQRLTLVLPSPPRLPFRNAKTLKDHLVMSKLKITNKKPGVTICERKNCEICHILHKETHLKVRIRVNNIRLNFHLTVTAEMWFTC